MHVIQTTITYNQNRLCQFYKLEIEIDNVFRTSDLDCKLFNILNLYMHNQYE